VRSWQKIPLCYQADPAPFFKQILRFDYPIWLDSCAHATSGRYDILSASPVRFYEHRIGDPKQYFEILRQQNKAQSSIQIGDMFFSGCMGFMNYEFGLVLNKQNCFDLPNGNYPKAWFGLYDWACIVDHHLKQAYLIYRTDVVIEGVSIDNLKQYWAAVSTEKLDFELSSRFESNIDFEEYQTAIESIKKNICWGETYQVNFSQCFSADFTGDPFEAYCILRQKNPAEYAAFLRTPAGDILSFSPELLVAAKHKKLLSKPIKGTAKRYFDEAKDREQQQQLMSCPKNRAENMMIVDLVRNDLSKVSHADSVRVAKFLEIEVMPSVFHLVSSIESKLLDELDFLDVLTALFPGGSITGAPKYRTMELITQYEQRQRGIYCGSIGFLSENMEMCFNIAIRTMYTAHQKLYCPAGGGIVYDSDAKAEYQETYDKVAVLTRTFEKVKHEENKIPTFS
jgi:para-aminobenzoate synthetase component 1